MSLLEKENNVYNFDFFFHEENDKFKLHANISEIIFILFLILNLPILHDFFNLNKRAFYFPYNLCYKDTNPINMSFMKTQQ